MSSLMYNTIGILGDILVMAAYFLLQLKKLKAETFIYSFLNLIGAALVLFSLCFSWNLPSALIESVWIIISFYGVIQALKARSKGN